MSNTKITLWDGREIPRLGLDAGQLVDHFGPMPCLLVGAK